jgi:hypothetical protein
MTQLAQSRELGGYGDWFARYGCGDLRVCRVDHETRVFVGDEQIMVKHDARSGVICDAAEPAVVDRLHGVTPCGIARPLSVSLSRRARPSWHGASRCGLANGECRGKGRVAWPPQSRSRGRLPVGPAHLYPDIARDTQLHPVGAAAHRLLLNPATSQVEAAGNALLISLSSTELSRRIQTKGSCHVGSLHAVVYSVNPQTAGASA